MTRQTIDEIRVSKLAFAYWQARGEPLGSPEVDWHAAEATLGARHVDTELQLPGEYVALEKLRCPPVGKAGSDFVVVGTAVPGKGVTAARIGIHRGTCVRGQGLDDRLSCFFWNVFVFFAEMHEQRVFDALGFV